MEAFCFICRFSDSWTKLSNYHLTMVNIYGKTKREEHSKVNSYYYPVGIVGK